MLELVFDELMFIKEKEKTHTHTHTLTTTRRNGICRREYIFLYRKRDIHNKRDRDRERERERTLDIANNLFCRLINVLTLMVARHSPHEHHVLGCSYMVRASCAREYSIILYHLIEKRCTRPLPLSTT